MCSTDKRACRSYLATVCFRRLSADASQVFLSGDIQGASLCRYFFFVPALVMVCCSLETGGDAFLNVVLAENSDVSSISVHRISIMNWDMRTVSGTTS